jgi:hypothetical protein
VIFKESSRTGTGTVLKKFWRLFKNYERMPLLRIFKSYLNHGVVSCLGSLSPGRPGYSMTDLHFGSVTQTGKFERVLMTFWPRCIIFSIPKRVEGKSQTEGKPTIELGSMSFPCKNLRRATTLRAEFDDQKRFDFIRDIPRFARVGSEIFPRRSACSFSMAKILQPE